MFENDDDNNYGDGEGVIINAVIPAQQQQYWTFNYNTIMCTVEAIIKLLQ